MKAKLEYDIVIELATEVNNIVLRLKAIEMENILSHDSEFLSAVFRALPNKYQDKWFDFEKILYPSEWAAFIKFLEVSRNQALETKVLLCGFENDNTDQDKKLDKADHDKKFVCRKCSGLGHKAKDCSSPVNKAATHTATASTAAINVEKQKKEKKRKAEKKCGKCPVCKNLHTFFNRKENEQWPADRLYMCEDFKKLAIKDRAALIERVQGCPLCTSWNHRKSDCSSAAKCRNFLNGNPCGGSHSSYVCGSGNAYCGSVRCSSLTSSGSESDSSDSSPSISPISEQPQAVVDRVDLCVETALSFEEVRVKNAASALICWDGGSTRCLVTHKYAKDNGFKRNDIVYRLDVVGNKGEVKKGGYYEFELELNDGTVRKLWAYGIDKIMEDPDPVDMSPVRHLLPNVPEEAFLPRMKKPVDILIGNNFLGIHPSGGQGQYCVGDIRAYESKFGCGWVLAGSHPSIRAVCSFLSPSAVQLARTYKCEISPELQPSFWEGDCLGVLPPKRCGKCLRCKCSDPSLIHSRKDQDELEMLQKSVKLENGKLHVTYPFIRDPHCLPYNRNAVVRIAEKQEKRLLRAGMHSHYNQEFQKYVDRGGIVELTSQAGS